MFCLRRFLFLVGLSASIEARRLKHKGRAKQSLSMKGASIWDAWVTRKLPLVNGYTLADGWNFSGVNMIGQAPTGAAFMSPLPHVNFKVIFKCEDKGGLQLFASSEFYKATFQDHLGTPVEKMHGMRSKDVDIYYEDEPGNAFTRGIGANTNRSFVMGQAVFPCQNLRIDIDQGITRTEQDVEMDRQQVKEELSKRGYNAQEMQLAVNAYGHCTQKGHYVPGIARLLQQKGYATEQIDGMAKALSVLKSKEEIKSVEQMQADRVKRCKALVTGHNMKFEDCHLVENIVYAWTASRMDGLSLAELEMTREACAQEIIWGGALKDRADLHAVSNVYYGHGPASTGGFSAVYNLAGGSFSVTNFPRDLNQHNLVFELTQTCTFAGTPLLAMGKRSAEQQARNGNPFCYEGRKAMLAVKLAGSLGTTNGYQVAVYLRRT